MKGRIAFYKPSVVRSTAALAKKEMSRSQRFRSQQAEAFDLALSHDGLSAVQRLCLMRDSQQFPLLQAKLRRERAAALGMESFQRNRNGQLEGQLILL